MMELKDTVVLMNSADYKNRFKAEYHQAAIRYERLKAMLEKWDAGKLNFTPTCPRSTYTMQIAAMTNYLAVLEARALMEHIELDNEEKPAPCQSEVVLHKTLEAPTNWDALVSGIRDRSVSLKTGDTVSCTLLDGRKVRFVVTEDAEDYFRFESVDCLGTTSHLSEDLEKFFDGVWAVLPDSLKHGIMSTERRFLDADGELQTKEYKLFLPSASEVFPEDECYGDEGVYQQMDWYKDRRHRIRLDADGDSCCWWTLSAYSGDSTNFVIVASAGSVNTSSASSTWLSAPVCFQIPKS